MRALILFASEEGQTEKIAKHIAEGLAKHEIPCDTFRVGKDPHAPIALDAYDAVVAASPVHYSHYDPRLASYLREYRKILNVIPTAFISVSLGILSDQEDERAAVRKISDEYLCKTGWSPAMKLHLGGALAYSKYGLVKRHLLHWIAKQEGTLTDMQYDYEFTDWPHVDEFIVDFARFVDSCKQPPVTGPHNLYPFPVRPVALQHRKTSSPQ